MEYSLAAVKKALASFGPKITSGTSLSSLGERRPARDWIILLCLLVLISIAGALFGLIQYLAVIEVSDDVGPSEESVRETSLTIQEIEHALTELRADKQAFTEVRATPPQIVDPSL